MSQKKPAPFFEVRFKGVYPWKIPLRKVTDTLAAIKQLASGGSATDTSEDEQEDQKDSLGLLDVQSGSAVFRFVGNRGSLAINHFKTAGRILENPDDVGVDEYVLGPIRELSKIAKSVGCPIDLKEPGKGGLVLATIEDRSFDSLAKNLLITGNTRISGKESALAEPQIWSARCVFRFKPNCTSAR